MIKCLFGHNWRFDYYMDVNTLQRRNEITCSRCNKLKCRYWGSGPYFVEEWIKDHLTKKQLRKVIKQIEADYGKDKTRH